MLQIQSRISSKNQTVVPSLVREALNLSAGDRILWQLVKIGKETKVIAEPKPTSWASYARGLGSQIWQKIDIEDYIKQLRDEW